MVGTDNDEFREFLDKFGEEIDVLKEKTRIAVMVLGPNIDDSSIGANLRRFLIDQCSQHGIAIKGEHKGLRRVYSKSAQTRGNACSMEFAAARTVDAMIIIPDSAGSLVELGLFAMNRPICSKTILLFHEKHGDSDEPSFIKLGPIPIYERNGAMIRYVNYRKKKDIWLLVDEFLRTFRDIKFDQQLLTGG